MTLIRLGLKDSEAARFFRIPSLLCGSAPANPVTQVWPEVRGGKFEFIHLDVQNPIVLRKLNILQNILFTNLKTRDKYCALCDITEDILSEDVNDR